MNVLRVGYEKKLAHLPEDVAEKIAQLMVLDLKTGDKLVVKVPQEYCNECNLARVREATERWAGVPVIVLPNDASLEVVRSDNA